MHSPHACREAEHMRSHTGKQTYTFTYTGKQKMHTHACREAERKQSHAETSKQNIGTHTHARKQKMHTHTQAGKQKTATYAPPLTNAETRKIHGLTNETEDARPR